ncbi:MAG: hypothetical protein ACI8TX_002273 [Hyphomicrobiaceae bacterium]|jgi:membrane protein implicated in regulation of membrane protease activity
MVVPTFLRYAILQIPALLVLALVVWLAVRQGWIAGHWGIVAVLAWVAKDLAMYPLVSHAYEAGADDRRAPVGCRGVVTLPLSPQGRVRVRGENWRACVVVDAYPPGDPDRDGATSVLEVGCSVVVYERQGHLLLVRPTSGPT